MDTIQTAKDVFASLSSHELTVLRKRFGQHTEASGEEVDSVILPPPTDGGSGGAGGVPALADPVD